MNATVKSSVFLGLGLLLALAAGVLVFQWLHAAQAGAQRAKAARTVPLVVAARELAAGTRLEPDMLRVAEFPAELAPGQHYGNPSEVAGRQLASALGANEPVTSSRLAGDASAGINAVITPGKRAMAVRGNKVMGLAGFVKPGNMVDVLVTLPLDGDAKRSMTKTVLENVPVLATGTQLSGGAESGDEGPGQTEIYTLELTPHESEKLALASTQGTLHFALRNAKDTDTVLTEGADVRAALASYRAARPGRKGPENTVELISGASRSRVSF